MLMNQCTNWRWSQFNAARCLRCCRPYRLVNIRSGKLCGQEDIERNLNYTIPPGNHFQHNRIHRGLYSVHPFSCLNSGFRDPSSLFIQHNLGCTNNCTFENITMSGDDTKTTRWRILDLPTPKPFLWKQCLVISGVSKKPDLQFHNILLFTIDTGLTEKIMGDAIVIAERNMIINWNNNDLKRLITIEKEDLDWNHLVTALWM